MSQIANEVAALLAGARGLNLSVEPDQGYGSMGKLPSDGIHLAVVKSLEVRKGSFSYKVNDQAFKVDALLFQFHFQLESAPTAESGGDWDGSFNSRVIEFPVGSFNSLPDNQKTRVEIGLRVLFGAFTALLQKKIDNVSQLELALQETQALLSGSHVVLAKVVVETRTRTYVDKDGMKKTAENAEVKIQERVSP